MKILSRDSLELGGFAGIVEHRLVTDSRVFGSRKKPETFEGLGNMVYLADAKYKPNGASGMHPHSEIDVISIIIEGRVSHEGSMEHGKDLVAGDVQVQRAGGEGFSHNEINPDNESNRMLQVWALPEKSGQPAAYKSYTQKKEGITQIYGGESTQDNTFDSHTIMEIVHLKKGKLINFDNEQLVYIINGNSHVEENSDQLNQEIKTVSEGDLIFAQSTKYRAINDVHMLVIRTAK